VNHNSKTTVVTHYEVLGVDRAAKSVQLRQAYRKLARKYHPDVNDDPKAHERMAEINAAFETLIDPERRLEYDATIKQTVGVSTARPDSREYKDPETVSVKLVHRLKDHRTPIYGLSFADDTNQLVSSAFDNEVIWWDPINFSVTRRLKLEGGVVSTIKALDQDRLVAAGSSESIVSVWVLDGDRIDSWRNSPLEWVSCVGVSPEGKSVAMGSVHHTLQVCRSKSGDAVFAGTGHSQGVTAVAWSSDGRFVATGSADATVKLWSGVSGKELHTFKAIRSTVSALAFSPDNEYLAVAAVDLSIRIFRLSDLTLIKTFFGHEKPIESIAWHPDGVLLGTVSRDGSVRLWNVLQGSGHAKIDASPQPLSTIAFSADGKHMAVGGLDKVLRVWELSFAAS
jgi:WD40 repeat protein